MSIIGSLFGVMFAFFGAEGSRGMIQNIIPSSPWNITIGQMVAIFMLLAFITTIFWAFTNMLLSHMTRSAVATMAVGFIILGVTTVYPVLSDSEYLPKTEESIKGLDAIEYNQKICKI